MSKIFLLGAWMAALALSQTPQPPTPPTQTLTLAQAEAIALKNHPKIAAAQNVAYAAGQRVTEARAPYYPRAERRINRFAGELWRAPGRRRHQRFAAVQPTGRRPGDQSACHRFWPNEKSCRRFPAAGTSCYPDHAGYPAINVILGVNRAYYGVLESQALVKVAQETVNARQVLTDQVTALASAQLKSQLGCELRAGQFFRSASDADPRAGQPEAVVRGFNARPRRRRCACGISAGGDIRGLPLPRPIWNLWWERLSRIARNWPICACAIRQPRNSKRLRKI